MEVGRELENYGDVVSEWGDESTGDWGILGVDYSTAICDPTAGIGAVRVAPDHDASVLDLFRDQVERVFRGDAYR